MGWKAQHDRIYEDRVVQESLTRLDSVIRRADIPLKDDELKTLARRARQSVYGTEHRKERYRRYQHHLAGTYGGDAVATVVAKLEEINNAIAWEEK